MKNNSLWIILQRMRFPFLVIVLTYVISMMGLLLIEGVDAEGKPYQMTIFDAFYFISYTATTIGFGETPYTFTYPQRIWVSFSIYLTVIGWFYAIGTLVALLQDQLFQEEIAKSYFRRKVKVLKQDYVIVLGYNYITREIIEKLHNSNFRVLVIEKDANRANALKFGNFTPSVPVLVADAHSALSLEMAGIKSPFCKAVVSLFEDDALNLRIALTSKLLNPKVKLAIKSTTINQTENLRDIGVEFIENPFVSIASQIEKALRTPFLLKLEHWVYQVNTLNDSLFELGQEILPKNTQMMLQNPLENTQLELPKGKYIVCGFGRMGRNIYNVLKNNAIEVSFVEINALNVQDVSLIKNGDLFVGNADDKTMLNSMGIQQASAIIAGTNDDTINLSILMTAKKLNPHIITIARENEFDNFSIFRKANIHHIFMPSKVLINKTVHALVNPISERFLTLLSRKDDAWGETLVKALITKVGVNPLLYEMVINEEKAIEIHHELTENKTIIALEVFHHSRCDRKNKNQILPLLLIRNHQETLLPKWSSELKVNDRILFACDENAMEDIQYIAQNMYELHYILTGEEKSHLMKRWKQY